MAPGNASISVPETVCIASTKTNPAVPARRTPAASPRPAACPTRTVTASAMPSGTMKAKAATFSAT